MAPPMRLTDPERTSPTANTPRTFELERQDLALAALRAMRAGDDEAGLVELHTASLHPACRRVGADEQKDVANVAGGLLPVAPVPPGDAFEPVGGVPSSATISVSVISSMFGVAAILSIK